MNIEIQQIIDKVKRIGVDDDETMLLTETNEDVEISKIKTMFSD